MTTLTTDDFTRSIAIVGMSGRFPKARNIDEFWQNLRNEVEAISFFSDEELLTTGVAPSILDNPHYVKAKGILDDVELFDASFFGMNPREAEALDPQHRIFLECAWEALENAGYDPETYGGAIGVYAGASMNSYLTANLMPNHDLLEALGEFQAILGNDKDFMPTRVSYKLNLRGPSINVQTACSTSLTAVQLACQSLLDYLCDMALAGGVSVTLPHKTGYLYQEGMIRSPDGHCRAFDAQAQGIVSGEGVGVVVLKRLTEALAEGDYIHAVIRGTGINNDGSGKVGYTAPSVDGQAEAIATAQSFAGVEADTITYVETHGTGTLLGDPVEIAALTQAFRMSTYKTGFCAIGSVKTNIGHLDAAAGVAGLIKTVLALKHKQLPPSLHFKQPNPKIDFAHSPFYVNTTLSDWKSNGSPRRAGVSSFGIGGTNAHVVLEEAPEPAEVPSPRAWQLLTLSARTGTALEAATQNLAEYLRKNPETNLADVAYTLQVGRKAFGHRRTVVCRDLANAANALETLNPKLVLTAQASNARQAAFMFTGQGAQYVNMAHGLYETEPTFRQHVDGCAELLKPHLALDLRETLYPTEAQAGHAAQLLQQTYLTQPALFVIEYALAQLWLEWGVTPQAMIGHSIGEYVAACLSGVFSLEDALRLVAARGRLMQSLPAGAMLTMSLPESQVQTYLNRDLSLAVVNAPNLCTMSGPIEAIERLEQRLNQEGMICRRLHTSHAFHSTMMEPILDKFVQQFDHIALKPPQRPFISNVTGTWITAAEATDPGYWARHLRQTVRFADGVHELLQQPDAILLEVGPGQTLSTLARQQRDQSTTQLVLSSLRHPQDTCDDNAFMLSTLGQLWAAGAHVDWQGVHTHEQRRRVPLPTYPFERQRYWVEPQRPIGQVAAPPALGKRSNIGEWFYVPSWKRRAQLKSEAHTQRDNCWLVFLDESGVGAQLLAQLQLTGDVISVRSGSQFGLAAYSAYVINLLAKDDYVALLADLRRKNQLPTNIVHLWTVSTGGDTAPSLESADEAQQRGFYSLLYLAQAISELDIRTPIQLDVVSNGLYAVTGDECLYPEKATVSGPCRVIPLEYPNIACRNIDIVLSEAHGPREAAMIHQLAAELLTDPSHGSIVAQRGPYSWLPTFEAARFDRPRNDSLPLSEQGVYLITGGLGGIGWTLAEDLARTVKAKLVLIERSPLLPRDRWSTWLMTHDADDAISQRIRSVQSLEDLGAQVLLIAADVADLSQMQAAVADVRNRFGAIHGVIHAAGLPGGGMIQLKTPEMAEAVLSPKVKGTLVLATVLRDEPLDFFVLCSSINSILPSFGQVDYCAANAFIDAFAQSHQALTGTRSVSINWGAWQQVGMAVNTPVPQQLKQAREDSLRLGILPEEGQVAFRHILQQAMPQVVVSPVDFTAMLARAAAAQPTPELEHTAPEAAATKANTAPRAAALHPRPNLRTAFVAPRSEMECAVADIWQNLLGIQPIGLHDNFFELGGHSLLATQFVSRLRDQLHVELPQRSLFEATTVAELAERLETMLWAASDQHSEANVADDREEIEL